MRPRVLLVLTTAALAAACTTHISMDDAAEQYVKLVLALGQHDPDYVDAYYGPEEWRTAASRDSLSLAVIRDRADQAVGRLQLAPPPPGGMESLRREYLVKQLLSVSGRARLLMGEGMSFDEESELLYDAVAPVNAEEQFQSVLDALAARLPGAGSVQDRYVRYRSRFVIPPERLDTVFGRAIAECRARTARFLELPDGERFTVEYVRDKSWSAYNWYQGEAASLIQVNTDLPVYIDRAIDLACHEGYPGHHVYNALLERHLVRERGWVEFSVYPLFSPQSLIAEGSANYGIEMAFPGDERLAFEAEVLYPLAGLDPTDAEPFSRVQALVDRLGYAGNEAARGYLDGEISADEAAAWLERYALMSGDRARQRVRFIEQYRSYVINYNLGKDLVARYIEREAGAGGEPRRWEVFGDLLGSPRLPSGLRERSGPEDEGEQ